LLTSRKIWNFPAIDAARSGFNSSFSVRLLFLFGMHPFAVTYHVRCKLLDTAITCLLATALVGDACSKWLESALIALRLCRVIRLKHIHKFEKGAVKSLKTLHG
jgi:hypothetical protein